MKNLDTDFLVIGGGIVGLAIAIEIQKKFSDCKVTVIEKEASLAFHGSGRNSGVLHSGIYYHSDSLKAKFTKDGNEAWSNYCLTKGLNYRRIGKLIIPRNHEEVNGLNELEKRAIKNNIAIRICDSGDIKAIEPNALDKYPAIFVEDTAVVDPKECMQSLLADFKKNRGEFLFNSPFLRRLNNASVETPNFIIKHKFLVNAAGLYADDIAHQYGCDKNLKIIPFKGLYLSSKKSITKLNTLIYPVPDLNYPFLGTHFTASVGGYTKIGPTAMPALWKEQYSLLERFSLKEFLKIGFWGLNKMIFDKNLRSLAINEYKKLSKKRLVQNASSLLNVNHSHQDYDWYPAGIRAQLYDIKTKSLEMDFKLENLEDSIHILNAVSPAFTCAFTFGRYVADMIEKQ